jgi:hypothetical protein
MPTIHREDGLRFSFFSNENSEPAHVHVKSAENQAKFWLEPVSLAYNYGFTSKELGKIEGIILLNKKEFLEAWNEHFRS